MKSALCIAVAASLSLASAAQAEPDLLRYYPVRAQKLMVEGSAVISCTVTAEGTLVDCSVIEETPPGYGFGEAAVQMSVLFKMRPKADTGASTAGGTVRVPIVFKLPKNKKRSWFAKP